MTTKIRETNLHVVDSFTDRPFRGNPAGVCLLERDADARWMQNVAMEMNLSETAFVVDHGERFGLRWFTPTREVPLCGHATLASAHVLWETGRLAPEEDAVFDSHSGELIARRRREGIELDFPQYRIEPAVMTDTLLTVLGREPERLAAVPKGLGEMNFIAELETEEEVRAIRPNLQPIRAPGSPGVIVTAPGAETDYVCRYFVPGSGIDEDPVTGSVNCALASYWGSRLAKRTLTSYQASARGGRIRVELVGDRVLLTGRAVTTVRGKLAC